MQHLCLTNQRALPWGLWFHLARLQKLSNGRRMVCDGLGWCVCYHCLICNTPHMRFTQILPWQREEVWLWIRQLARRHWLLIISSSLSVMHKMWYGWWQFWDRLSVSVKHWLTVGRGDEILLMDSHPPCPEVPGSAARVYLDSLFAWGIRKRTVRLQWHYQSPLQPNLSGVMARLLISKVIHSELNTVLTYDISVSLLGER